DGGRLPRDDWQLDAAPQLAQLDATVTAVAADADAKQERRVQYEFTGPDGTKRRGSSWSRRGPFAVGDRVTVEALPSDVGVSRVRGLHATLAALWLHDWAGLWLLPALFCTGLWLARVQRTWVVLRHGRAAPAQLLERRQLLPALLRVRYAFAT